MGFFNMEILKVVFVIIGTLIGAGFASGQEIYTFFFSFGIKGLFGIAITSILIGITIYKTLKIIDRNNVKSYKEFLDCIIKSKRIKKIVNILVNIFILASFYIMIAGFGAYLEQEFNLNNIIGSGILAILCLYIFKTNIRGLVKANEILIPILIAVVIFIGIINIKNIDIKNIDNYLIQTNNKNWIIKSILYASYNMILLMPVLTSLEEYITKEKNIKFISIIVSIIVSILLSTVFLFLINVDVNIKNLEMPAVYAISNIWPNIKNIYGIIILISIFTTAISLGISFLKDASKNTKQYNVMSILICITSVLFSNIGFSNLVNLLYPILGVLGLLQILQILLKG